MSDPRFSRLKTDPRFRRPRKQQTKIVVDERFKSIFETGKGKKIKKGRRVDKYGRSVSDTHDQDNLRRFYRLEKEDELELGPDYARGEVVLESSDDDNDSEHAVEGDSDQDEIVALGLDQSKPIPVPQDNSDVEIDLDESSFADLDAQAAAYNNKNSEQEKTQETTTRSRRLAVVNLDWDHVHSIHLYKIFSSLVSPTAPALVSSSTLSTHPDRQHQIKSNSNTVVRGKVMSVRVYPSEFGKERIEREGREGPPAEVFKKRPEVENEEDVNEQNIYEVGDGEDYDDDALRKYQLERLRYYYAIVTCDTVEAASHIYNELDGTELERSANVFDLRFVPDDMTFDEEFRDEATEHTHINNKGIDFVTDALRHSKVKLTWDEDDPERKQITRRALTRQEIEEADFRAYLASSGSESEGEGTETKVKLKQKQKSSRDRLRALLLGGDNDTLPEGWGNDDDNEGDVDMEITFMPGLSEGQSAEKDETTLEKYQRKMKEKRKKQKEDIKGKEKASVGKDDFFVEGSDDESTEEKDSTRKDRQPPSRPISTPDELALLATSDNPNAEPKHFNLKSVLKAEKKGKARRKRIKKDEGDDEIQEDFSINVKDDRFNAVYEDHTFAIDPSNPHFKKTKSMSALLAERSKRQKDNRNERLDHTNGKKADGRDNSLHNLVESVKRKSQNGEQVSGKRRKL